MSAPRRRLKTLAESLAQGIKVTISSPGQPDRTTIMQTPRPDIRLDRETWDGRLQVETISARGIEAFKPNGDWFQWRSRWIDRHPNTILSKANHDACLRAYIKHARLTIEGEECPSPQQEEPSNE